MHDDLTLREQWDHLNAAGLDLPFLGAPAVTTALRSFGNGSEQLLVGSRAGRAEFMAVLQPHGRLRWSTFQPSQMPLGCLVCDRDVPSAAAARQLVRDRVLGLSLVLSFTQLDPLLAAPQADQTDNRHDEYITTAWLEVQGSFDSYWAARGKNLRQNMKKQRNKLAAEGIVPTLHWWRSAEEMPSMLARFAALEGAGWKEELGTAIHSGNAQGLYYAQLLEDAARHGEALASELRFGERTVAMNFGLLRGGTWTVLKTTYDESVGGALSPASLLREEELRLIFAGKLGIRRIEYYGRMMEWHTKLTDQHRTLYHLSTYRWPWLKRLAEHRRASASETNVDSAAAPADGAPVAEGPAPRSTGQANVAHPGAGLS